MNQSVEGSAGLGTPRSRKKTFIIAATVIAVVMAGGIWAFSLPGTAKGNDAGESPSTASPSASGSANGAQEVLPSIPAPAVLPAPAPESSAEASARAAKDEAQAAIPQPVAPVVSLTQVAEPGGGITATVTDLVAVDGKGQGPGQIAGPAIRFTLNLNNGGSTAIDTGMVVVNVEGGPDHVPALVLSGPGAVNFPASTAPGAQSSGTFVFLLPDSQRDNVRIFFNFQVSSSIAAFEGAVPKAQG